MAKVLGVGGDMSDNSGNPDAPVPTGAGTGEADGPADSGRAAEAGGPADGAAAGDAGKGREGGPKTGRADAWKTFPFKRAGGLEGRRPRGPAAFREPGDAPAEPAEPSEPGDEG